MKIIKKCDLKIIIRTVDDKPHQKNFAIFNLKNKSIKFQPRGIENKNYKGNRDACDPF